jgi:hypothetical protein
VWCSAGRNSPASQAFFEELGDRLDSIRAISIHLRSEYQRTIPAAVRPRQDPSRRSCTDRPEAQVAAGA